MKTVKSFRMEGSEKLKKGEKNAIAEKTGYSLSHVCNVIAGRRDDVSGIITKLVREKTRRRK